MATQYACGSENRRANVLASPLNGLDYLEVLDADAPAGTPRQRTLVLRCLKPVDVPVTAAAITIAGGTRISHITAEWAGDVATLTAEGRLTPTEEAYFNGLPDVDELIVIRTDRVGDFSTYRLQAALGATFDSMLCEIDFSFKVECPSAFDCRTSDVCAAEAATAPRIDYLAKDYDGFRRIMLDRLAVLMPDWAPQSDADLGITIVEALAHAADLLSYRQDAIATESYLGLARRRTSVRRHARLLDYTMHEGAAARVWVQVSADAALVLPAGTVLLTHIPGAPVAMTLGSAVLADARRREPLVFETQHDLVVDPTLHRMTFYTWGDDECRLPQGAVSAALDGDYDVSTGDVLIIVEARDPETGLAEDADPDRRHAVRITSVSHETDPVLADAPLTRITWSDDDALPFPLCVSTAALDDVSVALGNVVLAEHGETVIDEGLTIESVGRTMQLALPRAGLAHVASAADSADPARVAAAVDPRSAAPAILEATSDLRGVWNRQADLFASGSFAPDFVVETDEGGAARLRFGDGVYGRAPLAEDPFTIRYRLGGGAAGNVGSGSIRHLVTSESAAFSVANPLPARGGAAPERLDDVRRLAPQAFRTQERAVTEADYAEVARRHPEVQRAHVVRRWTGSWRAMTLAIDRVGGAEVDGAFVDDVRSFLEQRRLAAHDLELRSPAYVALDIAMTVCIDADASRSEVLASLYTTFGDADASSGVRGFFHPDEFTFGDPVYLSAVVARAMETPGVAWVDLSGSSGRFQRYGERDRGERDAGLIDVGPYELIRLDNDPSLPENGRIEFTLKGGR